jgi:hypothetical protein
VRQLSRRTIDGKEDRARDGYHNGAVPFGYLPPLYPKARDNAPSTWRPPRMPVRVDPATFPALVKVGELAAVGYPDLAIAKELAGFTSTTARFGERALSKDTVATIRRMWFPREFAPGCGHGTVETPSGELVEGRHVAAWPYELWQRMVETKAAQYRRPHAEAQRRPHEFSRIVTCAACRRQLRATAYKRHSYYRDTSGERQLPEDCLRLRCRSGSEGAGLGDPRPGAPRPGGGEGRARAAQAPAQARSADQPRGACEDERATELERQAQARLGRAGSAALIGSALLH